MAVHGAMIDRIDQNLGRVLETLEQTGQYDNTVIIFLSDNGASPEKVEWDRVMIARLRQEKAKS